MSFRLKTILGIATIEAVLLFILIWSSLNYLLASNEEELIKRASTTATLFATTTKDAVLATDLASLEAYVDEILKNPGVVYARVISEGDGVLAAGGRPEALRRPFRQDATLGGIDDGVFDTAVPISEGGNVYGRVEIGLTSEQIGRVIASARKKTTLIAGAEMLLTALFSFVLGTYLTRELKSLKEASNRLAAGELGYQIVVHGRDELAQAAHAFNDMSRKLKISQSLRQKAELELSRLNEDVEQRVRLRTKKLGTLNRELKYQTLRDPLTRLPNRLLFGDRLEQALRTARVDGRPVAVMIVDLNNFKSINDTLGHHAGNMALQQYAYRIQQCLADSDTLARCGGDEFVVLQPQPEGRDAVRKLAERIIAAVAEPLVLVEARYDIGAHVGFAVFPDDGDDADQLMRHAEVAMHVAESGKQPIVSYDASLDEESKARAALREELRQAIEKGDMVLRYQPKVDFHDSAVVGVNALVRWNHPVRGLVMPTDFIELAEQAGLTKMLAISTLRHAVRQAGRWYREGVSMPVVVNIFAANLHDPEFPGAVDKVLRTESVPTSMLELNVTETAIMMDPLNAWEQITRLHELGIQIYVSDFSGGYNYMSFLKKLNITGVKIDRAVIVDMQRDGHQSAVVRSIIELAHNLGLRVVAEGVETERLWDQLKTLGCDEGLGYYVSQPLQGDEVTAWVGQSPWHRARRIAAS